MLPPRMIEGLRWENKTPHVVRIVDPDGDTNTFPESRYAIRVNQNFIPKLDVDGIIIGRFEGVPEFKNLPVPIREDTIYIVSGITAQLMARWNFVSPRSDSVGLDRGVERDIRSTTSFVSYGEFP